MADQPGSYYWLLIEPVWIPLNKSWDDGPKGFLTRFRDVPTNVGHLYAAHWCQSEVCNGGFYQFFFNTTGILAPEAFDGYRAIGLAEWSAILQEAMEFFGPVYPRDRNVRLNNLPASKGHKREVWDPFFALDERFYTWLHAENDRWERAADRFAGGA